ncbi:alpha/beta-hydrolase [Lizonia empirigonia]|nr:alpha/beta-hydrolase [Lizonia empirigonia]KAF1359461.1 alpha/beta-hydrolase [Lizonia empirigonia]
MSDLPTLVFVPGAWHRPACYIKVIDALRERYHLESIAITLPSTTGNPEATFKEDLDTARTAIASETAEGRNVVVIAHSYGGMVANSAIQDFTPRPSQNASTGHVVGLVLIASGFTLTGLSFMDPLFGIPPPSWRVNKETGFADIVTPPRQLFYHDLSEDEAGVWVSQLTSQSLKALFEGGEHAYAGWRHVPVWYIGTIEDQGLPVVFQRMHVGMAREMGALVEHRELRSSHSPFLSQPNEVVELLVKATAAFTGAALDGMKVGEGKNEVLTPVVHFWQPYSWFRFGLPLAFGHVLGRCILLYCGARKLWRSPSSMKAKTI